MEGSAPHSASHSRAAPPPPSARAVPVFLDNIDTNQSKYSIRPRAEQYSEIFDIFRPGRACSIPLLDLPPFDDSSAAFDISGFVYSEIFGGFDFVDFALSCDQLFRCSHEAQVSSKSDAGTQAGTQSQLEEFQESDPSTCSEINNCVPNGDFHQTATSKFNFSYQNVNMVEVAERYSSEAANDIISPDVSSVLSVETQTKSAFVPSHVSFIENGTPYGISLIPTILSESGPFLTTEPPHAPQTSAVNKTKDPVNSVSKYESPKSNSAKSLFDVSSLEFLNAEFDTVSSGIASAEAIREATDTAKVKLNNVRELMNIRKDGVRPLAMNNMNGTGRVRMVFHESVSRDDVLQPKHACDHNLIKISGKGIQDGSEASQVLPDSLQAEKHYTAGDAKPPHQSTSRVAWREDNGQGLKDANHLEDKEEACTKKRMKSPRGDQQKSDMCFKKAEEGSGKRKNEMCEKEENETKSKDVQEIKQCQKNVEAATMSDCYEKKLIDSAEKKINEKLEVAPTNNRTVQKVGDCEDLKSSNLRARLDDKSIKQTAMASDSHDMLKIHAAEIMLMGKRRIELRPGTVFGDMESKRGEMYFSLMSLQHLQQTATQHIMKESKHNHQIQSMSSDVSQRVGHKVKATNGNLDPEDIQNSGKFRSKEKYQREHLREFEQEREKEHERELEWEKIKKLQLKKLEKSRERKKEKELDKDSPEKNMHWEVDGECEREREREKDRMGAGRERAYVEVDDMAEQAEARQRAMAEARERLEKACADAREKKSLAKKASTEAQLRAEHIAAAEAREHAIQKAMAQSDTFEARAQAARSASDKISRDLGFRHTSSSPDLWNSGRSDEAGGDLGQRSRARLERHRRTVERVAKALAEKSAWDLIAEKEQAEKNSLSESLDGDIERWSKGKEGNLRALLSTLQYILGPHSGWHPIPLTEIIAPDAVKKAYRKATLCVHPDKLQQRGATIQQKYICEKVFDLLKDCWNKFNSEER